MQVLSSTHRELLVSQLSSQVIRLQGMLNSIGGKMDFDHADNCLQDIERNLRMIRKTYVESFSKVASYN